MKRQVLYQSAAFLGALLLIFYALSLLSTQAIANLALNLGLRGRLGIIFGIALTQVIAFLSTTPVFLVGARAYGYASALVLFYIATMISSALNYWIARTWGRRAVRRLVGAASWAKIEFFAEKNAAVLLFVGRIFGYFFCDLLSYAMGLAGIPFRKYFIYTMLLTPLPIVGEYLVFRRTDFGSLQGMVVYYAGLASTGLIFLLVLFVLARRRPPQ
jgi:uncharacterized membrane protein YdjX (TVP38/TMEM64 family)